MFSIVRKHCCLSIKGLGLMDLTIQFAQVSWTRKNRFGIDVLRFIAAACLPEGFYQCEDDRIPREIHRIYQIKLFGLESKMCVFVCVDIKILLSDASSRKRLQWHVKRVLRVFISAFIISSGWNGGNLHRWLINVPVCSSTCAYLGPKWLRVFLA